MNWLVLSLAVGRSSTLRRKPRTLPKLKKSRNIAIKLCYILKISLEVLTSCNTFLNCSLLLPEERRNIISTFHTRQCL